MSYQRDVPPWVPIVVIVIALVIGISSCVHQAKSANDRESMTVTVCDKDRGYKGRYYTVETASHGTLAIKRNSGFTFSQPELYKRLERGKVYQVDTRGIRVIAFRDHPLIREATLLPNAQPEPCN